MRFHQKDPSVTIRNIIKQYTCGHHPQASPGDVVFKVDDSCGACDERHQIAEHEAFALNHDLPLLVYDLKTCELNVLQCYQARAAFYEYLQEYKIYLQQLHPSASPRTCTNLFNLLERCAAALQEKVRPVDWVINQFPSNEWNAILGSDLTYRSRF